jgi:hypothetical protein
MDVEPTAYEESARIVEAFTEGEDDPRVIAMLEELAKAIREKALND